MPTTDLVRELPGDVAAVALDAVDNMLVVTDVDGRILYVNDAFTRVTGYTADDAVGGTPALLRSGVQDDDFYAELWATVLAGETWDGELVNRRRDGTLYTDRMTITPLVDEDGDVTNFIAVKRDVSSHLADLTAGSPLGAAHVDASGRLVYANHRLEDLLGTEFEVLLGHGWLALLSATARDRVRAAVAVAAREQEEQVLTVALEERHLMARFHLAPLVVGHRSAGVVVTVDDVTAEAAATAALRAREQYARAILDSLASPTAVVDRRGVVTAVNQTWADRATAAGARGLGPGADYLAVCRRSAVLGCEPAKQVADLLVAVLAGDTDVGLVEYACPEDATFWEVRITPLRTPEGGAVLSHSDITARRELELVLRERAVTDALTGLQNRAGFDHLAQRAAARSARSGVPYTVFFIDLDGFKAVNDEHGHDAGDQVLQTCAERLVRAVRATDVVARFGGDEFAVVAEGLAPATVAAVARRIRHSLDVPIALDDRTVVHVGASVGTARAANGETVEDVVERADSAMYAAKAARPR